jgi:hypothetical protein
MHDIPISFLPVLLRITRQANRPEAWAHAKQKEDILIHGYAMLQSTSFQTFNVVFEGLCGSHENTESWTTTYGLWHGLVIWL